ncbi:hypothetical protein BSLG_007733 [Batrachochytrium salamandrivorans]|nr:hypothetical protein BASA62_008332 [Batrachochytrium salamandrivorans]KAJ1334578.1 hypothetical protein BSLG_007733 [Batrachochytrium salamandrivorans]
MFSNSLIPDTASLVAHAYLLSEDGKMDLSNFTRSFEELDPYPDGESVNISHQMDSGERRRMSINNIVRYPSHVGDTTETSPNGVTGDHNQTIQFTNTVTPTTSSQQTLYQPVLVGHSTMQGAADACPPSMGYQAYNHNYEVTSNEDPTNATTQQSRSSSSHPKANGNIAILPTLVNRDTKYLPEESRHRTGSVPDLKKSTPTSSQKNMITEWGLRVDEEDTSWVDVTNRVLFSSTPQRSEQTLCGNHVAAADIATGQDISRGVFFFFPDLGIRVAGNFRIHIVISKTTVVPKGSAEPSQPKSTFITEAITDPFLSLTPSAWQGHYKPTALSKHFAQQGVRIPLYKTRRKYNRRGD